MCSGILKNAWLTCSSTNAEAEQHSTEDEQCPYEEQARTNDVLRGDLFWQGLSKVDNHAHGLNQRIEEELPVRIELSRLAPVRNTVVSGFDLGNC